MLLGIFQAATELTDNIDSKAFVDWADPHNVAHRDDPKSMFPQQFKFTVLLETAPLFLFDPELQTIFRDTPGGFPPGGMSGLKETKALANLMAVRSGISLTGDAGGGDFNGHKRPFGAPGGGGGTDGGTYKPPFKFVEKVVVGINASPHEVKRR